MSLQEFQKGMAVFDVATLGYSGSTPVSIIDPRTGSAVSVGYSLATWADLVALSPITNDGLVVRCEEVGVGGSLWMAVAALSRWILAGPCFLMHKTAIADQVALAAPKNTEHTARYFGLTRATGWDGNSKCIFSNGDILKIRNYTEYVYTGATHATAASKTFRLGTAHASPDTIFNGGPTKDYTVGSNVGNVLDEEFDLIRLSATSVIKSGTPSTTYRPGVIGTSATLESPTTVNDMDAALQYISLNFKLGTLGADDTLTQKIFTVQLLTPGV